MTKTLTYLLFATGSIGVIVLFLTSKTYTQLGLAVALYPLLAIVGLRLLPRKRQNAEIAMQVLATDNIVTQHQNTSESSKAEVNDSAKRDFLKLIGAAGLSLFVYSILNKRAEVPFFGKVSSTTGTSTLTDTEGNKVDPARRQPMDGYQISDIDDNTITYYGFTNKEGAWIIMREDTENTTFRYAKGETEFGQSWAKRQKLTYGYFHDVF